MNKSNNEANKNVLDTQPESASENEESDSVTDQSSSMSERQQKDGSIRCSNYAKTTTKKHGRATGNAANAMPAATQFSVQRSDSDGLRMRISAIRPTTITTSTITSNPASSITSNNLKTFKERNSKRNNNENVIEALKAKISNSKSQQKHKHHQQEEEKDEGRRSATASSVATMSLDAVSSDSVAGSFQSNNTSNANAEAAAAAASSAAVDLLPLSLIPKAPCLSDATESGLSEATTTTVAAGGGNEKAAKKIKVKRKKTQTKANSDAKRSLKKSRVKAVATAFSSDSEDDVPLKSHSHHQQQQKSQQQLQRAPRLLLTAIINSKNAATTTTPQLKSLTSLATTSAAQGSGGGGGSDNIGLSSSDNELPDLVSAAIKRVESDTDDTMTGGGGSAGFRKTAAKTKHLPQYQSTLLQDFMEKTQMLGQKPKAAADNKTLAVAKASATATTAAATKATAATVATTSVAVTNAACATPTIVASTSKPQLFSGTLNSNSQTESVASSGGGGNVVTLVTPTTIVKKRRGRPKKLVATVQETTTLAASVAANVAANINESADSGVISTASTTKSTSPLPKVAAASPQTATTRLRHGGEAAESCVTTQQPEVATTSAAAAKPKIDMAYLDKRMYATERVLYPPPRNKRRQSMSASAVTAVTALKTNAASAASATAAERKFTAAAKLTKEELQLDPVWRKIDVNKKFRRPSVSGYKSDGGGGNTTICSKILAAKSGYVSDYGSAVAARHSRNNNNGATSSSHQPSSHSHHHNSGYKSDASGKSRYSTRSCASRRSRAKSCGYRSDYKEIGSNRRGDGDDATSTKSSKFRRKRRCSTYAPTFCTAATKSVGNLNDEQDILQLAGLSLGQSSEESTEYVCKPSLESLPTTSVSKKYGEINRFIATGEYFGRGKSNAANAATFGSLSAKRAAALAYETNHDEGNGSQDCFRFSGKLLLQRKNSIAASEVAHEMAMPARKIKSRRGSAASYCSSYYSGTSRVRRRRRRKSFRFPGGSGSLCGKSGGSTIDSKLLTEIEIITSTFPALCRIHGASSVSGGGDKTTGAGLMQQVGGGKLQSLIAAAAATKNARSDKRALKKRKMSENLDFALLSAAAASGSGATLNAVGGGSGGGGGGGSSSGSTKRRHKKASASSSPDDHKLPLKKRHYLLAPGEKSTEAAVAVAAKLFASNAEAWAAAAAAAKTTATTKAQLQFAAAGAAAAAAKAAAASKSGVPTSAKSGSAGGLTPKKRHLLQQAEPEIIAPSAAVVAAVSSMKCSNSSPLRIVCDVGVATNSSSAVTTTLLSGGKLLDISPLSTSGSFSGGSSATPRHTSSAISATVPPPPTTSNEVVHKKRTRLEGLVTKIAINHSEETPSQPSPLAASTKETTPRATPTLAATQKLPPPQLDSEASCPPPGVFEPSVELEIQIPPIAKLSEAAAAIITKSEVDSPLLIELNKTYAIDATKIEGTRVVETLLTKTGGNLLLKRKRKKINRTGFPTVRRKKRKINEQLLLDVTPDISEQVQRAVTGAKAAAAEKARLNAAAVKISSCDRVPQAGEASANFVERASGVTTAATIRKPRVSVVALERLQGTPTPKTAANAAAPHTSSPAPLRERGRPAKKQKLNTEAAKPMMEKKPVATAAEKKLPAVSVKAIVAAKQAKSLRTEPTNSVKQLATPAQFIRAGAGGRNERKAKSSRDVKKEILNETAPLAALRHHKKSPMSSAAPKHDTPATPPSFSKSTVHKIITAKSLESKVKLPAGIDPNTNFSCKIRLKRRSSIAPPPLETSKATGGATSTEAADIAGEAAAKLRTQIGVSLEDDVLPPSSHATNGCAAAEYCSSSSSSSSGDERAAAALINATTTTTSIRKLPRLKKNYLPAGLFSDYFKLPLLPPPAPHPPPASKTTAAPVTKSLDAGEKKDSYGAAEVISTPLPLLQPPPYCEKYFRRSQIDFQLPYDIYWAAKNDKLPSRITVPSWNYRKIRTNIYPDAVRPNLNGIDHPTCNCKPDAGCGDNCLNRMVYTECSPSSCPTRERCRNQKIQRHEVAPGAERFMTTDKGWGVRTRLPIPKGTYIMEYVGEVVTEREFKDRMGTIYLNDTHHYCLHLDGGLVIDGHRMGSDGRFVNHSCQPNCEMQKWSVNGLSRMALFAKRPIAEGEELTYDYNFSLFNPSEGQLCRCNTPQCRGVIGGKSQRVKPLPPAETKPTESAPKTAAHNGRQRKRKARKNATTQRLQAKDVVVARVQQLSEREKKLVKQHGIFLVRNFEKIRRCKAKRTDASVAMSTESKAQTPTNSNNAPPSPQHHLSSPPNNSSSTTSQTAAASAAAITNRRPSTPNSLAAQISALCSPRNMKTRGLTHAVQDPEVEKMAKMAVILRDICATLETLKDTSGGGGGDKALSSLALANTTTASSSNNKKKKPLKAALLLPAQKQEAALDLRTVQANIEQGYYKQPAEFDNDMQKIFAEARRRYLRSNPRQAPPTTMAAAANGAGDDEALRLRALDTFIAAYDRQKQTHYPQLRELLLCEASALTSWRPPKQLKAIENTSTVVQTVATAKSSASDLAPENATQTTPTPLLPTTTTSSPPPPSIDTQSFVPLESTPTEDIIRCICGLYKDEGLMIQCARCMCWQHAECTKADVTSDTDYHCERCEPRAVEREIPLEDFTDDGHRYFLALMRGPQLHVRQGDAVYVLRDIPITDAEGQRVVPAQKHTYETIGDIDYNECDIFRVERLWKNAATGQRFIFGHHFLRPHETFHEPSRRFYPNEVVRVPLYEVVPIELVIGRCWVLDRTTYCKGRPIECCSGNTDAPTDDADEHCYICELRVDKSARFFSKAKVNYPTCTKSYAFRKFAERLKISKSYAPHDVDPSMLKTKKQKTDAEAAIATGTTTAAGATSASNSTTPTLTARQELNKTPQNTMTRKRQSSSPAASNTVHLISPVPPTVQTVKGKRTRLESVLKTMKLKWKKNSQNSQATSGSITEPPIDLSYLLSGRGARQRKTLMSTVAGAATTTTSGTFSVSV